MAQSLDDEDEKPLDPAVERVRRRVMRFMAINLGILFVALMAVAVAIVYRLDKRDESEPPVAGTEIPGQIIAAEGKINLPVGARILSQSLSGGQMAVQIQLSGGERQFLIYDLVAGTVVSRITVETAR